MTWLALPILAVFVFWFLAVPRRAGLLRADSLFVYVQLLMALGSLPLMDSTSEADRLHGKILVYTLIAFMLANMFLHSLKRRRSDDAAAAVQTFRPTLNTWLWLALSVVIIVAYFTAVGYSAFFEGLKGAASGQRADVATLRLNSYSGANYYYPGYVNQFKNALLPALMVVIVTYWRVTAARRWLLAACLVGFSAFALLGTGQRGAFVLALVMVVIYLYLLDRERFPRRAVKIGAVAIPLLLVATFALGRGDYSGQASLVGGAQTAGADFLSRLSNSNQLSSVAGFRYIYRLPIQDGHEWWVALTGVLPGLPGSTLSNEIFGTLYGSTRGTAPPSIWGSIYYNFGVPGIVVAPLILAVIFFWVSNKGMRPQQRNTLEIVGIAGVFMTMGTWAAADPTSMLNTGIVVYILMWRWGARTRDRVVEQPDTVAASDQAPSSATRSPRPVLR